MKFTANAIRQKIRLIIKGLACQIKNYITQVTSRPVGLLYLLELVYMIIIIEQYEEHNWTLFFNNIFTQN